jgi:hypothetical protein
MFDLLLWRCLDSIAGFVSLLVLGRKAHTVPYGTDPFSHPSQAVPAWLRSISRYATGGNRLENPTLNPEEPLLFTAYSARRQFTLD